MTSNQKGYILPYCIFLMVIILNMFIFVVLCSLNIKKIYDDKTNYNHIFVLEERAKRTVQQKIRDKSIENQESETIYYDTDFINFVYFYEYTSKKWTVSIHIKHNNIDEYAYIYYDETTDELQFKTR